MKHAHSVVWPVLVAMGTTLADSHESHAQAAALRVPRMSPVVIDGKLSPGEWDGSREITLTDGSRLMLRHDGENLFVGMRLSASGFPSLCVANSDTMRVLHASAALVDSRYERSGVSWVQRSKSEIAMRSGDLSSVGKAAQRDYLGARGWLASVQAMSATDREMQVSLRLVDQKDPRIAMGVYVMSSDSAIPWPTDVADGCTALKSIQGFLPREMALELGKWARLELLP
jgi:hypothetical protein